MSLLLNLKYESEDNQRYQRTYQHRRINFLNSQSENQSLYKLSRANTYLPASVRKDVFLLIHKFHKKMDVFKRKIFQQ